MANNTQATEFMSWLDNNLPIYLPTSLQKYATASQMQEYTNAVSTLTTALNNNEITLTIAETQMETYLTALANLIAGNNVSLPIITIPTTTIIQYIYYALPNIQPAQIINISSDGYTGIVEIAYNNSFVLDNYTIGSHITTIFTTPQGFINWYVNNRALILSAPQNISSVLTAQYNSMTTPITENGITYSNNEQMQSAYFQANGFSIIPYTINTSYAVSPSAINPATTYNLTTNELYMLLLTTSKQETQTQLNAQQQTQNSTLSTAQTSLENANVGTQISTSLENSAKNIGNFMSSPEFYLILGVVGIIGLAVLLKT